MVKLFVGNLPGFVEDDDLFDLFSQYGVVTEAVVKEERYGFVHMANYAEALSAIR